MKNNPQPEYLVQSIVDWLDGRQSQLSIGLTATFLVLKIYTPRATVVLQYDRLKLPECNEMALLMVVKKIVNQILPSIIIEVKE